MEEAIKFSKIFTNLDRFTSIKIKIYQQNKRQQDKYFKTFPPDQDLCAVS
jgi:hypothetical protein